MRLALQLVVLLALGVASASAHADEPVPDPVLEWMKLTAVPLGADLEPFGARIGAARVVGLGDVGNGSQESAELRRRMVEYLVARRGFTTLAIVNGFAYTIALDDYVATGRGDPKAIIDGGPIFSLGSTEALQLIEWLRRWNADRAHARVHIVGVSPGRASESVARLLSYLDIVDPKAAAEARPLLSDLTGDADTRFASAPAERRAAAKQALSALLERLDREAAGYRARSSAEAWKLARQLAVVARQTADEDTPDRFAIRAKSVAANLRGARGERVVLWSSNAVTALSDPIAHTVGALLAPDGDYLGIGFVAGRGHINALAQTPGTDAMKLIVYALDAPPADNVVTALARVRTSPFALDLRAPPAGPVAKWLALPHPLRELARGNAPRDTGVLPKRFDVLVYIDAVSPMKTLH